MNVTTLRPGALRGSSRGNLALPAAAGTIADLYRRVTLYLLWVAAVVGAFLLWRSFADYVFEDAFITYRYADNLAHGRGFVFTEGERVLGTTAPLYTLILAAAGFIGLDIPSVSGVVFAASVAGTGIVGGLVLRALGAPLLAVLFALVAVAGGPQVQDYFGLETPFVTCLVLGVVLAMLQGKETLAAVLVGFAFLTRYDSALLAILMFGLVALRDRRIPWRNGLIASAIVAPWLAFSQWYFGSVMPNTLGAKTGDTGPLAYFVNMARIQWEALWHFGRTAGLPRVLGPSAEAIALGLLAVGAAASLVLLVRRRPAIGLVGAYSVALLAGYALIGPSLDFRWYPVPAVFGALLFCFAGLSRLSQALRLSWLAPLAVAPAVFAGGARITEHHDLRAHELTHRGQYRFRVECYETMSDWVLAAGIDDLTYMTIEPGYFAYRSGNPAIDEAGLVTKGVYFHGDASRRTDRGDLIRERQPDMLLQVGAERPADYMTAFAGSVKFSLLMDRDVYGRRFGEILEGHRRLGATATPEIASRFHLDLEPETRGRWIDAGGIATLVGQPYPLRLDGAPYPGHYMYVPREWHGAETPSFRIDSDRIDFLFAALDDKRTSAQLVVDGAIVLNERGAYDPALQEFQRIAWDVAPWRGKVATIRFVNWAGPEDAIAFDRIESADDAARELFDDFECAHCSTGWAVTFDGATRPLDGPARTHGAGLLSSRAAAHSFGLEGTLEQVSHPFTIEHDEIRFHFMDFADNRIGVQLVVGGEVVREVLGWSTEAVSQVVWDVEDLLGSEAVLRIRDDAEPVGAWVGVDNVVFADRTPRSATR